MATHSPEGANYLVRADDLLRTVATGSQVDDLDFIRNHFMEQPVAPGEVGGEEFRYRGSTYIFSWDALDKQKYYLNRIGKKASSDQLVFCPLETIMDVDPSSEQEPLEVPAVLMRPAGLEQDLAKRANRSYEEFGHTQEFVAAYMERFLSDFKEAVAYRYDRPPLLKRLGGALLSRIETGPLW